MEPLVKKEPVKEAVAGPEKIVEKPKGLFSVIKKFRFKSKPKAIPAVEKLIEEKSKPPAIGISLMPEELIVVRPLFREKLLLMIIILVIILAFDFLFLFLVDSEYSQAKIEVANRRIESNNLTTETKGLLEKRDKILLLNQKVSKVADLLDNHIYWSNLLEFLETYTIPEVWFSDFSAEPSGILVLPAQAKDLMAAARQFVVFQEAPFVQEVEISGISKGEVGISFQLRLILDPKIFKK